MNHEKSVIAIFTQLLLSIELIGLIDFQIEITDYKDRSISKFIFNIDIWYDQRNVSTNIPNILDTWINM